MAKTNNLTDFLTDVANAIREKEGSSEAINPQAFVAKIRSIAGLHGVDKVTHNELDAFLLDLANTLREAKGTSEPINPQAFSAQILSIVPVITDVKLLPLFVEAIEPLTVSFSVNPIEYSLDNYTWQTLSVGSSTPTIGAGKRVYFRASGLTATSANGIGTFSATGRHNIGGNIMSMLYGADYMEQTIISKDYAFRSMFINDSNLISAKKLQLPAMKLSANCYRALLNTCVNLVDSPELPATDLASNCYSFLFKGSTSLKYAPKLPATIMQFQCYSSMFEDCSSLISASELPALTLDQECYNGMFRNCTNLISASELPATKLKQQCYGVMYAGCSNLEVAPVLPAPNISQYGYKQMFDGCSKLRYIKCLATNMSSSDIDNWVRGVASSGVFVKKTGVSWTTGSSGIPSGWTVELADE